MKQYLIAIDDIRLIFVSELELFRPLQLVFCELSLYNINQFWGSLTEVKIVS